MHQRLKDKMKEQLQSLYSPNDSVKPDGARTRTRLFQEVSQPEEVSKQIQRDEQQIGTLSGAERFSSQTFAEAPHREAWDQFSFASRDSQLRQNPDLLDSVLHYQSGGGNLLMNTSDHESHPGQLTPRGLQTSTKKERDYDNNIEIYNLDYQSADGDKNADHMLLIGHDAEDDTNMNLVTRMNLSSTQALPERSMQPDHRGPKSQAAKSALNSYSGGKGSEKSASKSAYSNLSPSKNSQKSLQEPEVEKNARVSRLDSLSKSPDTQLSKAKPEWNARFSSTAEKDKPSSKSGSAVRRGVLSPVSRPVTDKSKDKENYLSSSTNHQLSTDQGSKIGKSVKPSTAQLKQLEKLHDQSSETFKRLGAVYQQLIDEYEPWTPVSPDTATLGEMRDCAKKYTQTLNKLTQMVRRLKMKQEEMEGFVGQTTQHTRSRESASPSRPELTRKVVDPKEWKATASRRDGSWASLQLGERLLANLPKPPA